MNESNNPSTSQSCTVVESSPNNEDAQNEDWSGVISVLRKLHCKIITRDELIQSPRGLRSRPRCSVEGCFSESSEFLCRLPVNFELAFHCLAVSFSTIIVQNRLMTKLFNKTVLTKAFLNTRNDLKDIPFAVVESFPFHACHRHFLCSPEYYSDIFWEGRPKALLVRHLPEQSMNNVHEAGQVRQRTYLLVKLNIFDSKILPDVGIRIPTVIDTSRCVKTCAISGCSASLAEGAKDLQMLSIPRMWQEFHKWERSVWFGLQRDFCLPSVGYLCAQHFTEIMENPDEQEAPILFQSVKNLVNFKRPICVIPTCRNSSVAGENILYVPFPSSPSDRSAWVTEVKKHHPNFSMNPKKKVEWICCLHFTDLSSLESALPSVNLGKTEMEELSIGSDLMNKVSYSMSLNPLYVPLAVSNEGKQKLSKRKCCAETTVIFTKLAKLQEKSLTVFKLIEQLYVLYGLSPLKEDLDQTKDLTKLITSFDGKQTNLGFNKNAKSELINSPTIKTAINVPPNKNSPKTLADALAGLINRK